MPLRFRPSELSAISSDVLVSVEAASKRFCRDPPTVPPGTASADIASGSQPVQRSAEARRRRCGSTNSGRCGTSPVELRAGGVPRDLIGRNGAGKTTLLKMLTGLIKPDTGRITIRGRVWRADRPWGRVQPAADRP